MKWLVQFNLDGEWVTIARRSKFADAVRKARDEYRAMRRSHMTAVILEDDPPMLRRQLCENFKLI